MTSLRALGCLVLLASGTLPAPAGATPAPVVIEEPETQGAIVPGVQADACTLEPGPIQTSSSYAWVSPEAFSILAWKIPRASCTACPANYGLAIKTVTFRVRWFGPCTATAQVSVVGATGPAGCRVPDPSNVLCGPASAPIVGTASAGIVHTLTVPAGCCIGTEAFVLVRFTGLDACYASGFSSPGLTITNTTCVNCTEYVATTSTTPALTDWCTLAANSIWLQVAADCCGPVGVEDGPVPPVTRIAILESVSRTVHLRVSLAGALRRPVELGVYDIAGRKVRELLRTDLDPGDHLVDWDGTSSTGARLPAGVYKLRLTAGSERAVATAVLLE